MTDRELLTQALEALDSDNPDIQLRTAIVLRERLAQPERCMEHGECFGGECAYKQPEREPVTPLYTTPPRREWVGLTDAELAEFSEAELGAYDLCLEVEAKLKEKNSAN